MRYMPFIAALVLGVSAQPAFADSYQFPRLSGTFCATDGYGVTRSPSVCFTTQETDSYKQYFIDKPNSLSGVFHTGENRYSFGGDGCWYMYSSMSVWRQYGSPSSSKICVRSGQQTLAHYYEQFLFPDISQSDKEILPPNYKVTIVQYMSNFNILKQTVNIESEKVSVVGYCDYFTAQDKDGNYLMKVGVDRTPQSVMQACGFKIRKSEYVPPTPSRPDPPQEDNNNDDDQVTIPNNSKPCGKINNGNENVTVRSEAPSCALAKRVIKRYSRTLRSPRGWSCKASMNDAKFRAKCAKKTTSRAKRTRTIYGIWIRR